MTTQTATSSVTQLLDHLDAALDAEITPLPWEATHRSILLVESKLADMVTADSELIVRAVNALPQLTAAIRAVQELHVPDDDDGTCSHCWHGLDAHGACPTVRAITAALAPTEVPEPEGPGPGLRRCCWNGSHAGLSCPASPTTAEINGRTEAAS